MTLEINPWLCLGLVIVAGLIVSVIGYRRARRREEEDDRK